jgi:hypothetical protein
MLANLESERLESAAMRCVEWLIDRGIIELGKRKRDPRAAQREIDALLASRRQYAPFKLT